MTVHALSITSHSELETLALAKRLATSFHTGEVIVLKGPLGAGKTVFVRGLAQGLGIDDQLVTSPSYGFVNEYPGKPPLFHFDLYRLSDVVELYEIGWDEYLSRDGITVIEWGERAEFLLPARYYLIEFTLVDDTRRTIDIALVEQS
ncbi:MAG: tRNA (adenosine(37)-N6)-threonylcarbamoyltransferase complex ATPase subunit type 1 TsaE [Candidatus Zixiibacteriota bacterium]